MRDREVRRSIFPYLWVAACFAAVIMVTLAAGGRGAVLEGQSTALLPTLQDQLRQAIAAGDPVRSKQIVGEILAQPRLNLDFLLRLGIQLAQQGNFVEAALVFSRSVELYPGAFEAHYNLALAEVAQQHYKEARATLRTTAAANDEQRIALRYLRGKIEGEIGETRRAQRDLQAAFDARPNHENYALDLGLLDLRTYRYPEAASVFAKSLSFQPHSDYLALGLGLAQFLAGETTQSRVTTQQLLRRNPQLSAARLMLAYSLHIDGNDAAAESITQPGLAAKQAHPYLDYLDAVILLRLHSRDYARILAELKSAQQGVPRCSLCYVAESKAHQQMGASAEALGDLKVAIQMDPGLPEAWYRLAIVEASLGHHAEAANARSRFSSLKTQHSSRETEMLRSAFMKSLSN